MCLRPVQPLAQALDVFIRLVLLLVHFQQRPQHFDATLFLYHALSVFKLAYHSPVSGIRRCWPLVVICCLYCCWFLLLFTGLLVTDLNRVPVRCFFRARVRWSLNPHQADETERVWFLSLVGFRDG